MPKPSRTPGHVGSSQSERQQPVAGAKVGVSKVTLETVPRQPRRVFSVAEKLRIVKDADSALASGERGALEAMLRREGIYSSLLSSWRVQLGLHSSAGLAGKKPGRKPRLSEGERRNAELVKRNAELEGKLHVATVLIALQEIEANEVLGLALPKSEGDA